VTIFTQISVPMISDGIKSGVNCILLFFSPKLRTKCLQALFLQDTEHQLTNNAPTEN
jgi:hypothetical protein